MTYCGYLLLDIMALSKALLSLCLSFKNDGYQGYTMNCCRLRRPTLPYADHISIAVMDNGKG